MQRRAAAICAVLLLVVLYNIIVISVVWKYALLSGLLVAAVAAFLAKRGESYAIDDGLCDQFGHNATYNPNGWLRRR